MALELPTMVSPISAVTSSSPGVRALSRVAAVAAKVEPTPAPSAPASAPSAPSPGPGLRDALPAGYRNLNLPVGAAEARAQLAGATAAADSLLAAAYGPNAAALADLPRLVGARLPTRTILREAQAAALARAAARGETLSEFLDAAPIVAEARRPSRNRAEAEATLRLSLLARDGRDTTTLDVYVAKTGPRSFEAVAYDRDFAASAGGFPYAAAPVSVDRLLLDPTVAALVAAAAGLAPPMARTAGADRRRTFGEMIFALALAGATLLGVALALATDHAIGALILAGLGLGAASLLPRRRS
jgi:hypothetical protein